MPPTFHSPPATKNSVRPSRSYLPLLSILTIQFSLTAETWEEYGTQWKDHYNNNIAGKPIPTKIGPVLPALPTTNATGAEWAAWGEAVGKAWSGYFVERGINLAETVKGLEYPKEPTDNNWAAYAAQWSAYGDKVGERLKAALAAKESA